MTFVLFISFILRFSMNWLGEKRISINEMDLLADKNDMHLFCRNATSMMLWHGVTGTWINDPVNGNVFQSSSSEIAESVRKPDPLEFCQNQLMRKSSVKSKFEAEFIFKIMIQNGIRYLFINNTLIKDENWNWIDMDQRSRDFDVDLSNMLNLSSSGKEKKD